MVRWVWLYYDVSLITVYERICMALRLLVYLSTRTKRPHGHNVAWITMYWFQYHKYPNNTTVVAVDVPSDKCINMWHWEEACHNINFVIGNWAIIQKLISIVAYIDQTSNALRKLDFSSDQMSNGARIILMDTSSVSNEFYKR